MLKRIILAAMVASSLGGISGVSLADPLYVRVAPPPPRSEVAQQPRHGQVWVPGYWNWRGNRHVWAAGHWERARNGMNYRNPAWIKRPNGQWELQRGRWARGDADHDGIPNAQDRDRDGDGVRNRNDARPNDPMRR
jgi:hypothetical protein